PDHNITSYKNATGDEKNKYEEERRLFYVALTRAKNKLYIFHIKNCHSSFIDEIKKIATKKYSIPVSSKNRNMKENVPTIEEGDIVWQRLYGNGKVLKIIYGINDMIEKFHVLFDTNEEKIFLYPHAFFNGMEKIDRKHNL
ncbi:MAG: 3'-5' exonuclease, partial [Lachnospiraceae bacterium]